MLRFARFWVAEVQLPGETRAPSGVRQFSPGSGDGAESSGPWSAPECGPKTPTRWGGVGCFFTFCRFTLIGTLPQASLGLPGRDSEPGSPSPEPRQEKRLACLRLGGCPWKGSASPRLYGPPRSIAPLAPGPSPPEGEGAKGRDGRSRTPHAGGAAEGLRKAERAPSRTPQQVPALRASGTRKWEGPAISRTPRRAGNGPRRPFPFREGRGGLRSPPHFLEASEGRPRGEGGEHQALGKSPFGDGHNTYPQKMPWGWVFLPGGGAAARRVRTGFPRRPGRVGSEARTQKEIGGRCRGAIPERPTPTIARPRGPAPGPPCAAVGVRRGFDMGPYRNRPRAPRRAPAARLDISNAYVSRRAGLHPCPAGDGARWAEGDGRPRVLRTPGLPEKHHALGPSWASPCGSRLRRDAPPLLLRPGPQPRSAPLGPPPVPAFRRARCFASHSAPPGPRPPGHACGMVCLRSCSGGPCSARPLKARFAAPYFFFSRRRKAPNPKSRAGCGFPAA